MASEEGGNPGREARSSDVELSAVRLLGGGEEEAPSSSGNEQSWYSANGRGFSVNGRQSETAGGVSHVATVLGEAFYARERSAVHSKQDIIGTRRHNADG